VRALCFIEQISSRSNFSVSRDDKAGKFLSSKVSTVINKEKWTNSHDKFDPRVKPSKSFQTVTTPNTTVAHTPVPPVLVQLPGKFCLPDLQPTVTRNIAIWIVIGVYEIFSFRNTTQQWDCLKSFLRSTIQIGFSLEIWCKNFHQTLTRLKYK